jgi:hypothetical protein
VHNREDILLPHVIPFLQAHPDMTLQHLIFLLNLFTLFSSSGASTSLITAFINFKQALMQFTTRAFCL